MLLQIRATSGGGKTTLMRKMYGHSGCFPVTIEKMKRGGEKVLLSKGKWCGLPFYVVGPYDQSGTGGCDRISTIEEVIALIDSVAEKTHDKTGQGRHRAIVAFEGLLLAHSWGALGEHLHERYGERYINAFIDTTVEQCYKNVLARRKTAGADNKDKERLEKIKKNVYADYHRVELCYTRVIARGGQRIDIPYSRALPSMAAYLDEWVLLYSG